MKIPQNLLGDVDGDRILPGWGVRQTNAPYPLVHPVAATNGRPALNALTRAQPSGRLPAPVVTDDHGSCSGSPLQHVTSRSSETYNMKTPPTSVGGHSRGSRPCSAGEGVVAEDAGEEVVRTPTEAGTTPVREVDLAWGAQDMPINAIDFDPTGWSSTPREPENLPQCDQASLARMLERRARLAGRPHRIRGTLAQVKSVDMLLDTGAMCCLMAHSLFLGLKELNPALNLSPIPRNLVGVGGHALTYRGAATIDVEIGGSFALVQFAVVDDADETILGMDFIHQHGSRWDLLSGELYLGEGKTIFAQRSVVDTTAITHRVRLAEAEEIPANSQVAVRVKVKARGPMPTAGVVSAVKQAAKRYGVLLGRTLVNPRAEHLCVLVLNPTDQAVLLPRGAVIGLMHDVESIQALDQHPEESEEDFGSVSGDSDASDGSRSSGEEDETGETRSLSAEAPPLVREVETGEVSSPSSDGASSCSAVLENPCLPERNMVCGDRVEKGKTDEWSASSLPSWPLHAVAAVQGPGQPPRVGLDPDPLSNPRTITRPATPGQPTPHQACGGLHDPGDGSVPEQVQKLYDDTIGILDVEERKLLRGVLWRHEDIWARDSQDLGSTGLATHSIDTGDHPPIKIPARRVPLHKQDAIRSEVAKMLEKGIIEPCDGPWSSPVVLAAKKDGTLRFCIDYRKLNQVTRKDAYPLPRIEDNLDALSGSRWFTTLDLLSGFWQVEMAPDDKPKTAFSVGRGGLYQFKRMPFGLCNAPATFQRLMEKVLSGLQWEYAVLYIDDIVVFGPTVQVQLDRLEMVLNRLRSSGLRLKPSKCTLLKPEVSFLGHIVSAAGIAPDPGKVKDVRDWQVPQEVTEVRSFIGLCTYYRRFVAGFSAICKPLYLLTEKSMQWHWGADQQGAFDTMKDKLTSAPILAYPNAHDKFVLDTDASAYGIGGVLSQVQESVERVIAYGSRVLNKAERNYCVTRRELLAIVYFVKEYHHYLVGAEFLLRTDHAALYWLFGMKDLEGQPARWVERLNTYDMVIQHRPGKKHLNADALSRCHTKCLPRCKEVKEQSFTEGVLVPFEDFQTIRELNWLQVENYALVPSEDEEWSDAEWEAATPPDPLGRDTSNDERMQDAQTTDLIARVMTRAQARREAPPAANAPVVAPGDEALPERVVAPLGDGEPAARGKPPPGAKHPRTADIVALQDQQEFLRNTPPFEWTKTEIAYLQTQDKDIAKIRAMVEAGERPPWQGIATEGRGLKTWWARFEQLVLSKDGVLYIKWVGDQHYDGPEYRVVTPRGLQPYILREMHDAKTAGHLGMRKTCYRVHRSRFYWPGMGSAARRWVRNCLQCGSRKRPKYGKRSPLNPYHVGEMMERVSIDILGPFKPRTTRGNVYILTITDQFTRWAEAFALRDATGERIARHVFDFLCRFGVCKVLHSDQGSNVDGVIVRELCRLLGPTKTRTCGYHPEGNAITERENKVICDMLSQYCNTRQTDWDDTLPVVMMAYRSSVHRALGETPNAMVFGREVNIPLTALVGPPPEEEHEFLASSEFVQRLSEALLVAHEVVRDRLETYYRYQKLQYDKSVSRSFYEVGQAVWLFHYLKTLTKSKKLMKPYTGPHIVVARINDVVYAIQVRRGVVQCVHGNRIKPYYGKVTDATMKPLWKPYKGAEKGPAVGQAATALVASLFPAESQSHKGRHRPSDNSPQGSPTPTSGWSPFLQ
jgi:transposase InsO family protein